MDQTVPTNGLDDNLGDHRDTDQAVSLRDVHLSLGSGAARVHILKGVDLDIPSSSSLGIVGPSGSGKSTLLMVMAGLERCDAGRVTVAGEEVTTLGEDALATFRGANIGFVFQSFHLMQTMTALENVAVPLELAGVATAFDRARDMLGRVGLGERLSHYPAQMSGGEQQRVAIARALVPSTDAPHRRRADRQPRCRRRAATSPISMFPGGGWSAARRWCS